MLPPKSSKISGDSALSNLRPAPPQATKPPAHKPSPRTTHRRSMRPTTNLARQRGRDHHTSRARSARTRGTRARKKPPPQRRTDDKNKPLTPSPNTDPRTTKPRRLRGILKQDRLLSRPAQTPSVDSSMEHERQTPSEAAQTQQVPLELGHNGDATTPEGLPAARANEAPQPQRADTNATT